MELGWNDITIHRDHYDGAKLLRFWSWLVDDSYGVMLSTAMGDLFLERRDRTIWFLDTTDGKLEEIASDYEGFKRLLGNSEKLNYWFSSDLLGRLLAAGLHRNPDECFSPSLPLIIGGKREPANYIPCKLLAHHALLGPLHQKFRDLPPGTSVSGIDLVWE